MISNKFNSKYIVFQTPDGQTWLARYNIDNVIMCHKIGDSKDYTFDQVYNVYPKLMDKIKKQLNEFSKC